jgi:protein-disulfide isomerase
MHISCEWSLNVSREAKILTGILVAVVGGMIALFIVANQSPPAPTGDKDKIIRDSSHKEGSGSVQLVEFGDYQCPACGSAEPNVEQLMKEYDGKVTLYFRNFPLTQVHKNALEGAEAAEAAADQGKFWEMHNKLYAAQKDWSEDADPTDKLVGYAKDLGLDTDKFKKALQDEQFKSFIDQDLADANAMGLNSTPTFFINGTKLSGGFDYATLRDAVESALKK